MKNTLALLAVCTGLIALPATALAADTMMKASPMAMDATMLCRPAMAGEKATAMMGTKGIVCKMLPKMAPGKMMGPGMKADSAASEDAMWQHWLMEMMAVPMSGGTSG
jgi:hypothetical protein